MHIPLDFKNSLRAKLKPQSYNYLSLDDHLLRGLVRCYLFNPTFGILYDFSHYRKSANILNPTLGMWRFNNGSRSDSGPTAFMTSAAATFVECGLVPETFNLSTCTVLLDAQRQTVTSLATAGKRSYMLDMSTDGKSYLDMDSGSVNFTESESLSVFKQIAFTFNGNQSSDADKVKGYENGKSKSLTLIGSLPTRLTNTLFDTTRINYSTSLGVYGNAFYRIYAIWNRVLLPSEIKRIYEDQQYSWLIRQNRENIFYNGTLPDASQDVEVPDFSELIDATACEYHFDLACNCVCGCNCDCVFRRYDYGHSIIVYVERSGVPVNISSASVIRLTFQRPNDTTFTVSPTFLTDGTDGGIIYRIPDESFLSQLGVWKIQLYLEQNNVYTSNLGTFRVLRIL